MISPYTINIPDERLATIKAKVEAYDWSQLPDAGGWSAGVGVDDLKRLAGAVSLTRTALHTMQAGL
jgi:hypothetical protein